MGHMLPRSRNSGRALCSLLRSVERSCWGVCQIWSTAGVAMLYAGVLLRCQHMWWGDPHFQMQRSSFSQIVRKASFTVPEAEAMPTATQKQQRLPPQRRRQRHQHHDEHQKWHDGAAMAASTEQQRHQQPASEHPQPQPESRPPSKRESTGTRSRMMFLRSSSSCGVCVLWNDLLVHP